MAFDQGVDYVELQAGLTKSVIVYGYSPCDAFYNEAHQMAGEAGVINRDYFGTIEIGDHCTVNGCGKTVIEKTVAPIFEWKGYSICTFGDVYSVTQGYLINKESVRLYTEYASDFDYGVLATVNTSGEAIKPMVGDAGVLSGEFNKDVNDYLDIKVIGIPEAHLDTLIVFCVYVVDGGKVSYLDNDSTLSEITGVSYNSLLS